QQKESFFAWVDIEEFKHIPTADYRRGKAMHIYHKYVRTNAVLQIGGISPEERDHLERMIKESQKDRSIVSTELFDNVQRRVFNEIYHNTYQRFLNSDLHKKMVNEVKNAYNKASG
ncbi:unnamed protein product, partial [Discosporangium mesarthrocarpum]